VQAVRHGLHFRLKNAPVHQFSPDKLISCPAYSFRNGPPPQPLPLLRPRGRQLHLAGPRQACWWH
jgi:hypothetical protein